MARRALPLLLLPLLVAACGGTDVIREPAGVVPLGTDADRAQPAAADDDVKLLARAQLDLALGVYGAVAALSDDDLVLGPTSIATALLMVRAGAAGPTAQELDDVLGIGALPDPHDAANALDRALAQRDAAGGVDLSSANRVWADRGFAPREAYVAQLAQAYGAGLARLDLQGDPEGSREAINAWVRDSTRDRIPELFAKGTPTGDSRLVLTNAVALDAEWKTPFDSGRTSDADFRLLDGTVVQVPTMQGGRGVEVVRSSDWTAARLPYAGDELAMTVVVPQDLPTFERRLSADLLDEIDAGMRPSSAALSLPRFEARSRAALAPVLRGLGMPTLFDPERADLSGISTDEQLFVAAVQHEAVVTVDEKGTEAAAATGVDVQAVSLPMPVVVDRPFLFVVRDRETAAVLFLGRVTDPR